MEIYLSCDKSLQAKNNSVVIAYIDGEFTVKRFFQDKKGITLYPVNSMYKPIKVNPESDFLVWGVVTFVIHEYKMKENIYALVDCNNFYVSCERIFRPDLFNKPVVVFSNNDGCVVSRFNEVKNLGIQMGIPYFKIYDLVKNTTLQFSPPTIPSMLTYQTE